MKVFDEVECFLGNVHPKSGLRGTLSDVYRTEQRGADSHACSRSLRSRKQHLRLEAMKYRRRLSAL